MADDKEQGQGGKAAARGSRRRPERKAQGKQIEQQHQQTVADADGGGESVARDAPPPGSEAHPAVPFPVVGIGASAGGLEAFGEFFAAMPPDSGMAFVLVQHLTPDKESLVADILARKTGMRVRQIEDEMQVEPDCVYVIRPGHTLTLSGARLRLGESVERVGHRRPVDDFFRSLAREQRDRAIVIVMSGMGSNGTAGAQFVKAAGGLCIAQTPETAEFPSMPRSLIQAGLADLVLAPRDMPAMLERYSRHPYYGHEKQASIDEALHREALQFQELLSILRVQTRREFAGYKKPTLLRRIQRRMGLAQITSLAEYVRVLRNKPTEVEALADDLTINVTGFFRDPEAWEALRRGILAPLAAERASTHPIRAWVAGCASGEEAYTLAMLLSEEAERARKRFEIKIFATDTAERVLAHARAGIFPTGIESDLTPERLERFFDRDDHSFRIKKEIREMVVFAPQNLLTDPPFSRLDLCTCRNLLIYLEPSSQRRVLALLHFALREGGALFLGNSETTGQGDGLFEPVNKKWRIYRRIGPTRHGNVAFPLAEQAAAAERNQARNAGRNLDASIHRSLSEQFGPPLVVIDRRERVAYFQGATDPYLIHPTGEPTRNVVDMAREHIRGTLRNLLRRALATDRPATGEVHAFEPGGAPALCTVAPLIGSTPPEYFVVTFVERPRAKPGESSAEAAMPEGSAPDGQDDELRSVREELQSTIEELESSNEELKASNEEVTSINEELQSTNEELETSKEELQSLNEELTTVNSQLQAKIEELEATTNDLTNLLSSTDIAVVFLDTALRIRRFTPAVRDLLELIPSDIGRPLSHLAPKFDGDDLSHDARKVLERLTPIESEVLSHSGRWYMRRVLPYRTTDNRIDGVVITFIDITERKRGENAVREARERLQEVLEQMPAAVLIAEAPSGRLVLGNHQAAVLFGHPFPLPFLDTEWAAAYVAFKGFHRSGRPYQRDEWPLARALNEGKSVVDEEIRFVRSDGTRGTMLASAAPVRDAEGAIVAAVATFWDISDRSHAEQALRESERRFRFLVESAIDYAIVMTDASGLIVSWNSGAQNLFGRPAADALGKSVSVLYSSEDIGAGAPQLDLKLASQSDSTPIERWLVRADGSRFWCSGTIAAQRAESGALRGYLLIMRDMTHARREQKGLEDAKSAAELSRDSAEAANRAKDEFIATVSHELRTPLTAILLWARMLRSRPDPSMVEVGAATIERAARAQQQLVDDLLDVSRMASGKLKLSLRATRLVEAISAAVDAVRPAADARRIDLEVSLAEDIGIVRADPDRIQQVVWNLLSNAVKFTPSGGRVRLAATRENGNVCIVVSDTGIGMRPDFLPYLFDRFRQAQVGTTREHSGLGLGLAISRQLAELHGGSLTGTSEGEGKGATFTVRLPLARLPETEEPQAVVEPATSSVLAGRSVLLVEDDDVTRDALEALLRSLGAQVSAVDSARAGLEVLAMQPHDLIVSDIAMPGMDGYEMMREIRAREREEGRPAVPALAISAFARVEDQRRATESGYHAYLVKPVVPERLISVIGGLLNGS